MKTTLYIKEFCIRFCVEVSFFTNIVGRHNVPYFPHENRGKILKTKVLYAAACQQVWPVMHGVIGSQQFVLLKITMGFSFLHNSVGIQ